MHSRQDKGITKTNKDIFSSELHFYIRNNCDFACLSILFLSLIFCMFFFVSVTFGIIFNTFLHNISNDLFCYVFSRYFVKHATKVFLIPLFLTEEKILKEIKLKNIKTTRAINADRRTNKNLDNRQILYGHDSLREDFR